MIKLYHVALVAIVAVFILATSTEARINAEIDGDECKIVMIRYSGVDNFIHTQGYCQDIYDMCTKDFCDVRKYEPKELNTGKKNIGGDLNSTE